jgi:Ser/Thr protein kinase RdoA (MazF antagonist)
LIAGPDATTAVVPDDEFIALLQRSLDRETGAHDRIASIARRPFEYRTSFVLEELDVVFTDGRILRLLAKNVARSALTEIARRAKPIFLHNPLREIQTYQRILNPAALGTPRCYGAVIGPAADRYWLIIERIPGAELRLIGEIEQWRSAARWLAALHARFESDDEQASVRTTAPLVIYDRTLYQTWRERALAFSSGWTAKDRHELTWLSERYETVIERLLSLPATFIHGEFYASNVLVEQTASGWRVAPVDWEMAAIGPGLIDLAALTAGSWSEDDRRSLVAAYCETRISSQATHATLNAMMTDLAYCRLHLAVQWLGWSACWTPPSEHTHDWLGEAVRLASELQL